MEEKTNTKNRKKVAYYLILGICALLLIAGLVLTVYFVTESNTPIADKPPIEDPEDPNDPNEPTGPVDPNEPKDPEDPNDPSEPSGGEGVRFVSPIDYERYSVVYAQIYENGTLGWWYRHKAIDFDAEVGTEVRSMADGTVESVSMSPELGNLITIDHGDGLKTLYRFVEPVNGLKAGDKVTKGQKIGEVAESYGSEAFHGAHLHLEMQLNNDFVDPADYLEPVLDEK